jgi:hypothetical protein
MGKSISKNSLLQEVVADFSSKTPKFYKSGKELVEDGCLMKNLILAQSLLMEDILSDHKKRSLKGYV